MLLSEAPENMACQLVTWQPLDSSSRLWASQPEKGCLEEGAGRKREAWDKLCLEVLILENHKTELGEFFGGVAG